MFKTVDEKIAALEKELKDSRLLPSQVLMKIKGIFMESLAKMMDTP